jgi:hypothetical protein
MATQCFASRPAEDPSPGFAQLRDVVELSMCLKHLGGKEAVDPVAGLGKDTVGRLQGTLKINKRQLRRIEEIIVLHALDRTDAEQYKAFRVKVKKRLRQMYQVCLLPHPESGLRVTCQAIRH